MRIWIVTQNVLRTFCILWCVCTCIAVSASQKEPIDRLFEKPDIKMDRLFEKPNIKKGELLKKKTIKKKASLEENGLYWIGTGIYDITGPAAEEGMMGYGMVQQRTSGIYQRLWARAYVIESPLHRKRIAIVIVDLAQLFQGIKQEVIRKLQIKYPYCYDDANVLLSATHQHSGPGGYSTYAFYNLTTFGFNRKNFDTIVNGIVNAITQAHKNIQQGYIHFSKGKLIGISINRSRLAYLQNPVKERQSYKSAVDNVMSQLRFDTLDAKPLGILNWFPIHGTSMNNKNTLISGDNKGYAAYLFEKDFRSTYKPGSFVAGFVQSNAGDVSPNLLGKEGGEEELGITYVEKTGFLQYQKAKELYYGLQQKLTGPIDCRHLFVRMDQIIIENTKATKGSLQTTCPASIGLPMLQGTSDGKGISLENKFLKTFFNTFTSQTACQGKKQIILEMASKLPCPWTPSILPLQLLRLGNLVIVATPFELTTMAGRRLRKSLGHQFQSMGINHILLTTLANAYAGYVTTPEEYEMQDYEGASTHFGPWTLLALQQEFSKLATAMLKGQVLLPGPKPPNHVTHQLSMHLPVLYDTVPSGYHFGDLYEEKLARQPFKEIYHSGEKVIVKFWGANPRNNYRINQTFLKVQYLDNAQWKTIHTDQDWNTEYRWHRHGLSQSIITIVWRIPSNVKNGLYRIKHEGDYKDRLTGKILPYSGFSRPFLLSAKRKSLG